MEEYKGYGKGKIIIDGNNIFIKQAFIKEDCTFGDIDMLSFKEPTAMTNGIVEIFTKKQNDIPHSIFFLKKDRDKFKKLYNFISEKAPHANPENTIKNALSNEVIQKTEIKSAKFCPECGVNVEGMKFCPECGNQLHGTVINTQPQIIIESQYENVARCPKCGSASLSGNKKGFGIGKAVIGAALTGGIGLAAGNIGAKKVRITCLNCGHSYMAGKN